MIRNEAEVCYGVLWAVMGRDEMKTIASTAGVISLAVFAWYFATRIVPTSLPQPNTNVLPLNTLVTHGPYTDKASCEAEAAKAKNVAVPCYEDKEKGS